MTKPTCYVCTKCGVLFIDAGNGPDYLLANVAPSSALQDPTEFVCDDCKPGTLYRKEVPIWKGFRS